MHGRSKVAPDVVHRCVARSIERLAKMRAEGTISDKVFHENVFYDLLHAWRELWPDVDGLVSDEIRSEMQAYCQEELAKGTDPFFFASPFLVGDPNSPALKAERAELEKHCMALMRDIAED